MYMYFPNLHHSDEQYFQGKVINHQVRNYKEKKKRKNSIATLNNFH